MRMFRTLSRLARVARDLIAGPKRYRPELYYMRGKPSGHAPSRRTSRSSPSGRAPR
jgi:hypothetical protein